MKKFILSFFAVLVFCSVGYSDPLWLSESALPLVHPVWNDLRIPAISTKLGGSKDPHFVKVYDNGSGSQGVFTYAFDASTEEELYFMVQIPHGWVYGTALDPHIHWIAKANGTGTQKVSWGLEYTVAKIGGTFGNTTIIYGNEAHVVETIAAGKHYLTDLTAIDMTGVDGVSTMLICRVFRDATGAGLTDDFASDAYILEIDFHYQLDHFGSTYEYSK